MKAKRLLKLADFLEKLPEKKRKGKFDMDTFGKHVGPHHPKKYNYCGTSACALGWATTSPYFRRLGLKAGWRKMGRKGSPGYRWRMDMSYRKLHEFAAAGRLFDIPEMEAYFLFGGGELTSRRKVIRSLRKLARLGVTKFRLAHGASYQ